MAFDHNKANLIRGLLTDATTDDTNLLQALESFIGTYKIKQQIQQIPLNLFKSRNLGILEVVVKYLRENNNLNYHEIGLILNRDDRTIWSTFKKASHKHNVQFNISNNETTVNIAIFSDRTQSPLEALIVHLKTKGLSFKQISESINRDYKTVWLTFNKKRVK